MQVDPVVIWTQKHAPPPLDLQPCAHMEEKKAHTNDDNIAARKVKVKEVVRVLTEQKNVCANEKKGGPSNDMEVGTKEFS